MSIVIKVRSGSTGEPVILSDYYAEAVIYTKLLSEKIHAGQSDHLTVIDTYTISISLPPEKTILLDEGECFMELALIHKLTNTRTITRTKICNIEKSINNGK